MTSSFFGLDLGLRALLAQQRGLDVTNHNVANANTEGFSRQTVVLTPTDPYTLPGLNREAGAGQVGTGVVVSAIQRARNVFLDVQLRGELGIQHQAQVTQDALEEVETILNEPSESGISHQLGEFFQAWQALTDSPADNATRAILVQDAATLTAGLNRAARLLGNLETRLNNEVSSRVAEVNSIAAQVAAINRQIAQVESSGQQANDFRDRRDLLLDQLAQQVQFTTTENPDGSLNIQIGSHYLVQNAAVESLTTTATGPNGNWEVRFSSDSSLVPLNSGALRGLIDTRDTTLPGYVARLDQLAGDLISAVNGAHAAGYGLDGMNGRPFFSGTDASTIAVDPAIAADPAKVAAASAPNQAGNSATALVIAQLRHTMSPTPEGAFGALIGTLGTDQRAARGLTENQKVLVQLLQRRRQEVSGVSLDEEAVNVVRFQRAYEAAARLITANDQMLDRLINSTGIVGR